MIDNFNEQLLHELYKMIQPKKAQLFEQIAPIKSEYITLVLEHIYQQHNASAILRSMESFGFQSLHVVEKQRQYKVQRDIARGATRWVHLYHYTDSNPTATCLNTLKQKGYKIVVTVPDSESYDLERLPIDQPIALVFGSEGDGISESAKELADDTLRIPMYGFTQSFNVSVAAALCLYELRKRLEYSDIQWKLTHKQQTELKIEWCKRIIPHGEKVLTEMMKRMER